MNISKQLGKRIRFLRQNKKLSIEDLALESEINKNYLSDLERGVRNPTLRIMGKIAKALEISLADLLSGISEN